MAKGANIKQTKDSDIGRRSDKEEAFDSEQRKRLLDTENDCSTMTSSTVVDSSNIASTSDPENLSNSNSSGDEPVSREKWARKTDFLLSVAGGFVGLGNVWRFPYLCYKNGGGAFLIPYVIFMIGGGIPIFFLEVALGQYMSEGGITSWRLVPIATGIGYASMVIVSLLNIYYIIILAWALFYLFQSFTLELPWAKCDQYWNTACCVPDFKRFNDGNLTNATTMVPSTPATASNATMGYTGNITQCDGNFTSPETEFWERRVLGLSSGLEEIGTVRWELALCLLLAWVICYFCIWKGVKSTGKVVYFTATFPFLMLIVLLIRGVTLPGAIDGIKFYLTPDMERLGDPQVWLDAGTQIFFSYAICLGAMVSLGSYNKFHNNCYLDCIALSLVNSGTSFISGFAIFSVLGFMANEQGVNISQVAESGPGLAFIAYPKAITMMPASTLWAILFFVMLLLLGLDSQFVEVEGFVTSIVDLYPKILRRGHNREIFIALVCFVSYLIGLFMVTNGGMYVFQMFDYYAASGVCLLWVAFFEAFCIAWIYGAEKMWSKIADMIKYRPPPIIKYLWMIVTPLLTTGTFIYSMVKFKPLVYNKIYEYPAWGEGIGWLLALSSMIFIPGYAIYKMVITPGTLQERWTVLTTPNLRRNHVDYVKESKLKERIGGGKEVYSLSVKEENLTSGNPDTVASAPPDYESATSFPNNAQTFTFNTKF